MGKVKRTVCALLVTAFSVMFIWSFASGSSTLGVLGIDSAIGSGLPIPDGETTPRNYQSPGNYDLYSAASGVAEAYDASKNPNSTLVRDRKGGAVKGGLEALASGSNAGLLFGYVDSDISEQSNGGLRGNDTGGSQSIAWDSSFGSDYMLGGYALASAGFDEMSNSVSKSQRSILGTLLQMAYFCGNAADSVMTSVIKVLKATNFLDIMANGASEVGGSGSDNTGLINVADLFHGIYEGARSIGQVTIVFFLIVFVAGLAFWGRGFSDGVSATRGKRLLVRFLYIFAGLPILVGLYSGGLDAMEEQLATAHGTNGAADAVVESVLLDFNNMLYSGDVGHFLAGNVDGLVAEGSPSNGLPTYHARNARAFVATRNGGSASFQGSRQIGDWTVSSFEEGAGAAGGGSAESNASRLLTSYIRGDVCLAGTVDTEYKDMIEGQSGGGGMTAFANDVNKSLSPMDELDRVGDINAYPEALSAHVLSISDFEGTGMGPIALYNYLNSEFTSQGVRIYSGRRSQDNRPMHYAVTAAGTGANEILYLIDAILGLVGVAIIGFAYAMGMFFNVLSRLVRTFVNLSLGATGALGYMARGVVSVLMLIIEVVGTVYLYQLACSFLVGMSDLIMDALEGATSAGTGTALPFVFDSGVVASGGVLASGGGIPLTETTALLIAVIAHIVAIVMAVRLRSTVLSAVDEQMDRAVDFLFSGGTGSSFSSEGTGTSNDGGSGIGSIVKSGATSLATGLGASGVGSAIAGATAGTAIGSMMGTADAGAATAEAQMTGGVSNPGGEAVGEGGTAGAGGEGATSGAGGVEQASEANIGAAKAMLAADASSLGGSSSAVGTGAGGDAASAGGTASAGAEGGSSAASGSAAAGDVAASAGSSSAGSSSVGGEMRQAMAGGVASAEAAGQGGLGQGVGSGMGQGVGQGGVGQGAGAEARGLQPGEAAFVAAGGAGASGTVNGVMAGDVAHASADSASSQADASGKGDQARVSSVAAADSSGEKAKAMADDASAAAQGEGADSAASARNVAAAEAQGDSIRARAEASGRGEGQGGEGRGVSAASAQGDAAKAQADASGRGVGQGGEGRGLAASEAQGDMAKAVADAAKAGQGANANAQAGQGSNAEMRGVARGEMGGEQHVSAEAGKAGRGADATGHAQDSTARGVAQDASANASGTSSSDSRGAELRGSVAGKVDGVASANAGGSVSGSASASGVARGSASASGASGSSANASGVARGSVSVSAGARSAASGRGGAVGAGGSFDMAKAMANKPSTSREEQRQAQRQAQEMAKRRRGGGSGGSGQFSSGGASAGGVASSGGSVAPKGLADAVAKTGAQSPAKGSAKKQGGGQTRSA